MSRTRDDALYTIRQNTGIRVEFITDEGLEDYILDEHPLHPAYKYLNNTHKCDYLRAYLMHHYGGGYTDIKYSFYPWNDVFDELERDTNKWVAGYREGGVWGVANVDDPELYKMLQENAHSLIGNCAYICRPQTPFTEEWLRNVESILDKHLPLLPTNPPRHSRDYIGLTLPDRTISTYPLNWTEIHGSVFHPLCYKYIDHLLYTLPPPIFTGYL
jgi:hypothetical protein